MAAVVSEQFITKLKLKKVREGVTAGALCDSVGVDQFWLSKAINGHVEVKLGDRRIVKVGSTLGLAPHECFQESLI